MTDLRKTVVVTGGSSGIGKEIVHRFASENYRVAFVGFTPERVSETVTDVKAKFQNADVIGRAFDLKDALAIQNFFDEVNRKFGDVGILVNNAGVSPKENGEKVPTHRLTRSQFDDVIAINLTAPLLCVQHVLPAMMAAEFGRIIMIGSLAARSLPRLAGSAYTVSKAGLGGLARALVGEYGRYGITTNVISPGNIATGMTGGADSPQMQAAVERIPTGRIGAPDDFPGIVSFLCSEEAAFINGACIDVTGGEYVPA